MESGREERPERHCFLQFERCSPPGRGQQMGKVRGTSTESKPALAMKLAMMRSATRAWNELDTYTLRAARWMSWLMVALASCRCLHRCTCFGSSV